MINQVKNIIIIIIIVGIYVNFHHVHRNIYFQINQKETSTSIVIITTLTHLNVINSTYNKYSYYNYLYNTFCRYFLRWWLEERQLFTFLIDKYTKLRRRVRRGREEDEFTTSLNTVRRGYKAKKYPRWIIYEIEQRRYHQFLFNSIDKGW